jgi:hypothetical protein
VREKVLADEKNVYQKKSERKNEHASEMLVLSLSHVLTIFYQD